MKLSYIITTYIFAVLLSACGGGGGGATTPPAAPTVTVAGKVTFTSFNLSATGIDYNNPINKPIRGAVVELQSPVGTVIASANTTETGDYSFTTAPQNATVRILVKAALGPPAAPDTSIIDNTSNGALYAMPMDIATTTVNLTQDFNAGSGWGGASYTGSRTAAPFAMLDVMHQAQLLIKSADNAVVFPALNVNWSVNNKPTPGNLLTGDIGTSFYTHATKALYILGAADLDTDEYDSAVIGHEWGHYFEANFSRSDSSGGNHGQGDIVHPGLAFGEGFGTAIGAMILNSPLYIDVSGPGQNNAGVNNLEQDSIPDANMFAGALPVRIDGYYSEWSVMEVLYDIYDSGAGDDDAIQLGFAPIYRVLVNGQKNTKSFTSIFSFLHHLKLEVPASSAAIDALAAAENIDAAGSDEFHDPMDTSNLPEMYTTLTVGATTTLDAAADPLQTSNVFGLTAANNPGNKLLNQRFFRATAIIAGCHTLTVTPVAPTAAADIRATILGAPGLDAGAAGTAEAVSGNFTVGEQLVFNVDAFSDNAFFSVLFASTPAAPGC